MFNLFLVIHWRKCKKVHFWFTWKLHEWRRLIKTSAFGFLYLDTRLIFKLSFIPSVSKLVFNIFRIRSANFKGVRWVSSRLLNFIWNYPFGHLPESGKGALNTKCVPDCITCLGKHNGCFLCPNLTLLMHYSAACSCNNS